MPSQGILMKEDKLLLSEGKWYALRAFPEVKIGWSRMDASPVLITETAPLKTGKGIIRIKLIPLLFPVGPKELVAEYRVIHHRSNHMVAVSNDFAGNEHTLIFEAIDFDWLSKNTPKILAKLKSGWLMPDSTQQGLSEYFGRSLRKINMAASPAHYPGENELSPIPELKAYMALSGEYSEYDSFLIKKGFIPHEMEDKWLIYLKDDHLYFHRSWTGFCIYDVVLGHRDGRLYLSYGYVNRDPSQYQQTNIKYDMALVLYLIDALLLDKEAEFPIFPST